MENAVNNENAPELSNQEAIEAQELNSTSLPFNFIKIFLAVLAILLLLSVLLNVYLYVSKPALTTTLYPVENQIQSDPENTFQTLDILTPTWVSVATLDGTHIVNFLSDWEYFVSPVADWVLEDDERFTDPRIILQKNNHELVFSFNTFFEPFACRFDDQKDIELNIEQTLLLNIQECPGEYVELVMNDDTLARRVKDIDENGQISWNFFSLEDGLYVYDYRITYKVPADSDSAILEEMDEIVSRFTRIQ